MADLNIGDPIKVTVQKYDPDCDKAPYFKTYTIPYTREMRVLEALDYIVEEIGDSLAYQWFCGVKKCGMCGVMVNGRQTLGCWEPVQPEMVIEPLPHFPVERDLVIDRSKYFENTTKLEVNIQRERPYPGFPEPITSDDMHDTAILTHCIECMLCVSACPAYDDRFMGPASMVQLAKMALDPRDDGPRAELAHDIGGIDHCVGCYQCSRVCPTDIPVYELAITGLRNQIREQHVQEPLTMRDRLFGNIHTLSHFASRTAPIANWVGRQAPARLLAEKFFHIDQRRPLPEFASPSFDQWFRNRKKLTAGDRPQVVLFHDTFMTYNEPEIGIAATELLEAAGYEVLIVEKRVCCGRPMMSQGMIDNVRRNAEQNVQLLAPYAKHGIPIIGCEPSCLLIIREDYPSLLGTPDADVVSKQTYTLEEFLVELADKGELNLEFTDEKRELLLQGHCHQKALIGIEPTLKALSLPPNYSVKEIPTTCCGMAGANGYECEHYDRSIQAAEESLLPAVRQAGPNIEIVADGISCRQQIAHGAGRKARHSAVILRDALLR